MPLASVSTSSLIGVAMSCAGNVLISLALTLQKLAHRRQLEEYSRADQSSDSGSETISGQTPPKARSTGKRDNAVQAVPVILIPSPSGKDGSQGSNTSTNDGETLAVIVETPTPSSSSGKLYKNQANSILEEDEEEDDSRHGQEGTMSPKDKLVKEGAYLKSRLWWLGLLLIAIGEGGNFLSYGFAPASVVAPLGTVALIANCLFAPLILKERFHLKELLGMGLAAVGAITVVFSSSQNNPRLDPDQLVNAIIQIPFIVYTILTLVALSGLIFLSESKYGERLIGIDVGICALFGGYTVLSTKALSSLLSTIFLNAFKNPIAWTLLLVLAGTSVLQVKYLNRALIRFESKEVIPTQFVFFSLSAIIGSAVLYQEFRDVTLSRFINFVFGIATTFLGVHLLTSYQNPREDEEDDHSDYDGAPQSPTINLNTEQTPLLVPVPNPGTQNPLLRRISGTPISSALPPQVRIIRKTSNVDLTSTLGINTQAGFLLMATTPPAGSSWGNRPRGDNARTRSQRDVERGSMGRGVSYTSTRRGSNT